MNTDARSRWLTWSLGLMVLSCRSAAIGGPTPLLLADAAVYAVALDSLFPAPADRPPRTLLLVDTTIIFSRVSHVRAFWADMARDRAADSSALVDFERRNDRRHALAPLRPRLEALARTPITLVSPALFVDLPRGDATRYWEAFYSRFPDTGGVVNLSAVGFNPAQTRAVLYVNHYCHALCGEGRVVWLELVRSTWRVSSIRTTWVS